MCPDLQTCSVSFSHPHPHDLYIHRSCVWMLISISLRQGRFKHHVYWNMIKHCTLIKTSLTKYALFLSLPICLSLSQGYKHTGTLRSSSSPRGARTRSPSRGRIGDKEDRSRQSRRQGWVWRADIWQRGGGREPSSAGLTSANQLPLAGERLSVLQEEECRSSKALKIL